VPETPPASRVVARRRVLVLVALVTAPLALFTAVAEDVYEKEVFSWDSSVLRLAAEQRSGPLNASFAVVTQLGSTPVMTAAAGLLMLYLALRRRPRDTLFVGVAVGGAALLNVVVKDLFRRPRPDLFHPLAHAGGFAFPSGHTMSSMALAIAVIALTWHTRRRWPALAAAIVFALLVGVSRVYLGVHYPSDVVAGWALSLALVLVAYAVLYGRTGHRGAPARRARTPAQR